MAFDTVKKTFTKEHMWIVEITSGETIYRFCENRSPLPLELEAVPSLSSVSVSPAALDLEGGLGVRATASITLNDHNDYTVFSSEGARFWPRWRAENPYYQGSKVSVLSGYLVNGEYIAENFQARDYILEKWTYASGRVNISCKDPLKLTDNDRGQAPKATNVVLGGEVLVGDITITVDNSDDFIVGDYIRINSEVMQITAINSLLLDVDRGLYNTVVDSHSIDDAVQKCLYYNDTLPNIVYDIMVNYSEIDPSYINKSGWDNEAALFLPGFYETLLTEPVGTNDLLKELTEQAPHYLYWDERTNKIEMVAVKQPPDSSQIITDEANIIEGTVKVTDKNDMRISRVIVNFGQIDPTKKLDEFSNYRQAYVRVDPDSEINYGTSKLKTIYSRWINNSNKAAAIRLAARIGRRFAKSPRAVTFGLDAKDSDIWTGSPVRINTSDILNEITYDRYDMPVQVTSVVEKGFYQYEALEHTYGNPTEEDKEVDGNGEIVILSGEIVDINLRDIYDSLFPTVESDANVVFLFDQSCTAGGTTTNAAVKTGTWPELNTPPLIDIRGLLIGKGGDGADAVSSNATDGGLALELQDDIRFSNGGILGGGGGGGDSDQINEPGDFVGNLAGGGGAGFILGNGGTGSSSSEGEIVSEAQNGTKTEGGDGAKSAPIPSFTNNGGDLGQDGQGVSGGAAGAAIQTNGYTITYVESGAGDIRGAIL